MSVTGPPREMPPIGVMPAPWRWTPSKEWPRWIPLALGAWLFASLFMWPHSRDASLNTAMVGVLMTGFGALWLFASQARYVLGALALWLSASTLFIDHLVSVTMWNNLMIGIAVLVISGTWSSTRSQRVETTQLDR